MDKRAKILVVEDENDINKLLCTMLENKRYRTRAAFSGTEALMCVENEWWDMILLDLMIPGISGEEVIVKIREITKAPIIVISAKTSQKTKVELLEKGADDFICKPFDLDEVVARVNSNLRRYLEFSANEKKKNRDNILSYKDISLNIESKEVKVGQNIVALTAKEFALLKLLLTNPNKVYSKSNIFESIWGEEFLGDDNTVNVHVSRLRKKLSIANNGQYYIETIWAMGYKLRK
ncbi:response regulator transcription factor [Clostridium estertheticum]|uniref:response regulator transcription factor n=1 Tax=Clostridium estertheticum TaxID=238834 RepID=UPI001CF24686|nr:response regulator transcription factor [Clostridium estertheticum]MCB2307607.1 response regulator transcription factor [Clostridium estertheticum]MCB2346732.1 response regulator transcription factor [Clostridium estertheticum]MCB2351097.1 response regulator transcription factor [Clostridium estertheticum]WAG46688.1 response regulator transcription factor [Clostridium estertheticum]